MSKPVVVIGAGGHAKVLVDALQAAGAEIAGLVDRNASEAPKAVLGVSVLGDESRLAEYPPEGYDLVNAVGSVKRMQARRDVYERLREQGYEFPEIIHPKAVASHDAVIRPGAQILAGAVVGPGSVVGENAIVNTNAVVDHDCDVGAHSHVAPGATLSGSVSMGEATHIGTGASVIQGVRIGRECFVAAGAVVVRRLPDKFSARGVPAKGRKF